MSLLRVSCAAMDRTERFYKIELLIRSRGQVSFEALQRELEVSRATLKRDLQYLRERLDAPIVYDRGDNAYRFGGGARGAAGPSAGGRRLPRAPRRTSCRACGSATRKSTRC